MAVIILFTTQKGLFVQFYVIGGQIMNKYIKIAIVIVVIALIIGATFVILNSNKEEITYQLSDYGVSIKVPKTFKKAATLNSSHILQLQDEDGLIVSVTELKGDFWSSRRY